MSRQFFQKHSQEQAKAPDEPPRPTYEDFIDLQGAIVRAIALAWTNPGFKAYFKDKPVEAISSLLPNEVCPRFFNSHLSMEVMHSDFHHFMPEYTGGWVGDNDSVMFCLPPPPLDSNGNVDKTHTADALTAYAQAFTL